MKGKGSEGDNELCLFYSYITNDLFCYCIPTAGGGREGEGVLTAFLVYSYCLLIVLRLEGRRRRRKGEDRECLL